MHLGRGHTSGDLVVLFVEDRVLHLGDLFFNGRYPNIDLEAGGSVQEWIATLDRVLALDFDQVIPGHGPVTDREGIRRFQAFLRELWTQAEAAARDGKSLEETLAAVQLTEDAGYEAIRVPFVLKLDRPFVIRRAWEEATGAVKPQGPAAEAEAGRWSVSVERLFSVAGKMALVTGGSRGIGLMIARGLRRRRARASTSRRARRRRATTAAAELSKLGTCIALPGDLSSPSGHARARRGDRRARAGAAHPRQQRRRQLGRAARRVSRRRLGQGAGAQREGGLPPDARAAAAARSAASKPGDPARVINIGSIDGLQVPAARDLRVLAPARRRCTT